MRLLLVLLAITLALTGCSKDTQKGKQLLPIDIPPGTVFQPITEVTDFEVLPQLRIVRDPDKPTSGIVGVQIYVTSKIQGNLQEVQVAAWLPDGVRRYTPVDVIGTNLERWHVDLSPQQPKLAIGSSFKFEDFNTHEAIREAFGGTTRLRISWKGGDRFLQFPGSNWKFEVVDQT